MGAFADAEKYLTLAAALEEGFSEQVQYQVGVYTVERWLEAVEFTPKSPEIRYRDRCGCVSSAYCLEEMGMHKGDSAVNGLQADGRWVDVREPWLQRGLPRFVLDENEG